MKILSSEKLYLSSKKTKGYNDFKQELLRLLSRDKLYTAEYKGELVAIKTEDLYELQKKFRQLEGEYNKLQEVKREWYLYVDYLKDKYPSKDGKQWGFTCDYHKRIHDILSPF